ncbi:DNA-binding protein [Dacryopinax primogenitus]|uniref:DNA-binding protein n=1 Tax=Dacryopinax primogenitus (strain DJM 731) TaxID=1858805 RepID=M5FWM9_DACPD|nr:DNA-binding protein [Dacryopinax primogenitus]EJU00794.1 DNA-binding protein [Dacryopinax primogenitus]
MNTIYCDGGRQHVGGTSTTSKWVTQYHFGARAAKFCVTQIGSSHVHVLLRSVYQPLLSGVWLTIALSPVTPPFHFHMLSQARTITQEQSVQTVKQLLSAWFNCIAWIRNLLPADHFVDGSITNDPLSQSHNTSSLSRSNRVQLKTVKRGHSGAGDRLLDYLENGIFDALEKQYLRSFMFVVYLDPNDPNNIIESFTFSFTYHTIPGTNTVVPIMNGLHSDKEHILIARRSNALQAVTKGKVPTLREVRESVQTLVKRLIMMTQSMDELPPQRYVTFKLFYVDGTPDDYEPPFFRAADAEKDRFFFATHNAIERPDKIAIGALNTSFHGVTLTFASVCNTLPKQHDDLPFDTDIPVQVLSTQQRQAHQLQEMKAQQGDSLSRRVIWEAEGRAYTHDSLCDGDGEPDPDFDGLAPDLSEEQPVGFRDEDGRVGPMQSSDTAMDLEEAAHAGSPENDADFENQYKAGISSPYKIQILSIPQIRLRHKSMSDPTQRLRSRLQGMGGLIGMSETMLTAGINTLNLNAITFDEGSGDIDMGNGDYSSVNAMQEPRSERSLRPRGPKTGPPNSTSHPQRPNADISNEDERNCCCGIRLRVKKDIEDTSNWCQCEGPCEKWYHLWCIGYNDVEEFHHDYPELRPNTKPWLCFECCFRENSLVALLSEDEKQEKIADFKDLALFRLVLKLFIQPNNLPDGPSALRKRLGCLTSAGNLIWQRLEKEGLIIREGLDGADGGHEDSRTNATRPKPKSKQKARRAGPVKYVVSRHQAKKGCTKYFDKSYKLEEQIMGLKELRRGVRTEKKRKNTSDDETDGEPAAGSVDSQTQLEENVVPLFSLSTNTRRQEKELRYRPNKKLKVSLAQHPIGAAT